MISEKNNNDANNNKLDLWDNIGSILQGKCFITLCKPHCT